MPKRLKDHFIFEKQFLLNMLAIAVPIALQNMISFGVAMMDSVMLGGLGDKAISAANLGGQPFSLLMSIGFGLSSGGSVLIAQYWGRGDVARIRTVMRLSMQIVFTASSLMTLVCLLFPQQVMGLYSNEAEIVAAAAQYLQLVALSYLPYSISNNYIMSLRAVEKVTVSAAIYGTSFFVNVFFNYVFIFGAFGAPALGVRGAAVGTILARCSELLLVTIYMYAKEDTIGFRFSDCFRLKNEMIQDYTRHSLPVLGNELLWGLGISVTAAIIGRIGSVFVTANSIAGSGFCYRCRQCCGCHHRKADWRRPHAARKTRGKYYFAGQCVCRHVQLCDDFYYAPHFSFVLPYYARSLRGGLYRYGRFGAAAFEPCD